MSRVSQSTLAVGLVQQPSEGNGTSRTRFLGQRCKILLRIIGSLLHTRHPEEDSREIDSQKDCLKFYYNRPIRHLKPIVPGETVRMWPPSESIWRAAICTDLVGPRSYERKVEERRYRCNHRQIIQARAFCHFKFLLSVSLSVFFNRIKESSDLTL